MNEVNTEKKRILSVENLTVEYLSNKEVVRAVNDVSFSLNYGETIGLVGETGAGKTTIARSIMGILPVPPARVKAGQIYLDGTELLSLPEEEFQKIRGKRISMIFQDPMTALNPIMRVGKQISEVIQTHEGVSVSDADERAKEVLKMVGISSDRFREYPHQFSGGMKQRVVIAIALACEPDLLIADEPTTALDVTIQAQVLDMISELQHKRNSAMILITHDFGVVAKSCDKVGVVYGGQIVEFGTKAQIFKNPLHPYTQGLFDAIPQLTTDLDRLKPIFGAPPDPTNMPSGCFFAAHCPYAEQACRANQIPAYQDGEGHICRCLKYGSMNQTGEQMSGGNHGKLD